MPAQHQYPILTITKEQRDALLAERSKLMQLVAELPKAEDCGMDCSAHRADANENIRRINMLLQHFGKTK